MTVSPLEKSEEWAVWFRTNLDRGVSDSKRWVFVEKTIRGLIITQESLIETVEALRAMRRERMSRELQREIESARDFYNRHTKHGLGDLPRRTDFLIDMLKRLMRNQEILAREVAAARGVGNGRS